MAVQKINVLIDDVTGDEGAETAEFLSPIDGKPYVIDVTDDTLDAINRDLDEVAVAEAEKDEAIAAAQAAFDAVVTTKTGWFMEVARPKRGTRKASATDGKGAEIRQWAKDNGIEVSERGRLSAEVRAQFYAAQA